MTHAAWGAWMGARPWGAAPPAVAGLPRRVLVAGCGDVGTAAGLLLTAAGVDVVGLRRDPSGLPPAITPLAADLDDPASLAGLPDVDAVILAAAPDGRTVDAYARCYLAGPRAVLDALPRPPDRVVLTSTTAVYAQVDASKVDEDSPTEPSDETAQLVLAGEHELARRCGENAVALRIAGIYGPGRLRLIEQVAAGREVCGHPDPWTNRVHRDDVATAIVTALGLAAPAPRYVVVDDAPTRRCKVLNWLAAELGVERPPRSFQPARNRGGNKRCSNARLRATGWAPQYPDFSAGYPALLAEFLARAEMAPSAGGL